VVEQHKKHLFNSCVVIAGLLSLTWHRAAFSALPPAAIESQQQASAGNAEAPASAAAPSATSAGAKPARETIFLFPPVLVGGRISYLIRGDASEGQKVVQQGITGTITAKTKTYLWQPWFAWLTGDIGLNILRQSTNSSSTGTGLNNDPFNTAGTLTSKNLVTTGSLQLEALTRTSFPFEAHFTKSDNRISGTLSPFSGYASQTFGFSQGFATDYGNGSFGWDRSEQLGNSSGNTQQDGMRLSLSKSLSATQNLQIAVTRTDNRADMTDERAVQTNVNAQHSYTPDGEVQIDTLANASKSAYKLQQGQSAVDLMQLSSFGTWRPEDEDFTVTGGARLLTMANTTSGPAFDGRSIGTRIRNANFNVGVGYEISPELRATASANMNMAGGAGASTVTASESAGLTYQPASIQLGQYRYNWSASTTASNSSGGQEQSRNLSLQLSHGLSRTVQFGPTSALTMTLNQAAATILVSGRGATQRLTHGAAASWNKALESGTVYASINASDSRSMGGEQNDSFQMINFQVSSNMPTGRFGSLTGNLTIQATRQDAPMFFLPLDQQSSFAPKRGFTLTSSGSVSYQHMRVFGIPRLRFGSDLRLNSQALLPMLGGPQDMETAAWDNNLDYAIGRTQLKLNARVAQTGGKKNKSIMFTMSRGLGAY